MEVDVMRTGKIENTKIEIIASTLPVTIQPGEAKKNHIFIKFPKSILEKQSHHKLRLQITTKSKDITQKYIKEISLVGPI